jgi:4-amino-4-deoxy-L-arabinose transferase-like glycosyltransferase
MKYAPLWLLLFALALRLLAILWFGLDGLYGQDAFAYADCAGQLRHFHPGQIPCGDFYWPLGYPALAAMFMLLTGGGVFGAQLASVVAGAAVAPLCYWLVMESDLPGVAGLQRRNIALAAGLIAALCGALIMSSIVVMSDAAGLCWATLAACLLLRWARTAHRRRPRSQWLLPAAAAALALAIVTRWIYAALLPAFVAFAVIELQRGARAAIPRWWQLLSPLLAIGVALLIVLPQMYLTQHSGTPLLTHGWLGNWSLGNAVRTSFDNSEGHFDFRLPPIIFYAEPLFHPLYLFPLLTAFVFYGAWQLRRSPALILLGGWLAALGLYFIGIPQENLRFGLAMFTPIAVLTGVGICCFPIRLRRLRRARGAAGSTPAATGLRELPIHWLLLTASLAMALPFTWRALTRLELATDAQMADIRYLQSQLQPDATVLSFELSAALGYYTRLNAIDLYALSPQSLRGAACGAAVAYLYVDAGKLDSQWSGTPPAQNFHALRDQIGLQQLGVHGTWSLYRVQRCSH